jgi:hypothetical protein
VTAAWRSDTVCSTRPQGRIDEPNWTGALQDLRRTAPVRIWKNAIGERGCVHDGYYSRSSSHGSGVRYLSRWTPAEVGQVADARPTGDFTEACAAGGEEAAREAALAQRLSVWLPLARLGVWLPWRTAGDVRKRQLWHAVCYA